MVGGRVGEDGARVLHVCGRVWWWCDDVLCVSGGCWVGGVVFVDGGCYH